jgi:hypothetical protein
VICLNHRFDGLRHHRFLERVNLEQNLSGSMAAANNLAQNFSHLILIARYLILDFGIFVTA